MKPEATSKKAVVEAIAKNAQRLIADNRRLRGEVERLALSRESLREENRRLASEMAGLERRLAVKELAAGFSGEATGGKGAKTARARVNRLMREVDRCIVLLNRDA